MMCKFFLKLSLAIYILFYNTILIASDKREQFFAIEQNGDLYETLLKKTTQHVKYLEKIGLSERGEKIRFTKYNKKPKGKLLDLSKFDKSTPLPSEVNNFNLTLKNTLITTDQDSPYNKQSDIENVLNIRLYPALRELINKYPLEVFIGTEEEMLEFYQNLGISIIYEFQIPSSVKYYMSINSNNEKLMIMSGLVSRENMIAQLLTLKLAKIDLKKVKIVGTTKHFAEIVSDEVELIKSQLQNFQHGKKVLVIAGCGLERYAADIISKQLKGQVGQTQIFNGNIVNLRFIPLLKESNDVNGLLILGLKYGDISEKIVKEFLETFKVKSIVASGVGGYIPNNFSKEPKIGSRINILRSINSKGEIASLKNKDILDKMSHKDLLMATNIHVPAVLMETYEWLKEKQNVGASVDVEMFYIIRAIQNYNNKNKSNQVSAECGLFISDYIGSKPLREFSESYKNYHNFLEDFIKKYFVVY